MLRCTWHFPHGQAQRRRVLFIQVGFQQVTRGQGQGHKEDTSPYRRVTVEVGHTALQTVAEQCNRRPVGGRKMEGHWVVGGADGGKLDAGRVKGVKKKGAIANDSTKWACFPLYLQRKIYFP